MAYSEEDLQAGILSTYRLRVEAEARKVVLGRTYQCALTGFKGVAIARTEWLYGCVRVTLQPNEVKDGRPVDPVTLDEGQVIPVEVESPKVIKAVKEPSGGGADPVRRPDPTR